MGNGHMGRKMALTVCLLSGCAWCLALATRADSAETTRSEDTFKPVAPVESLMHGQMVFFKEINEQIRKPASSERNHEIGESAEILAELANVNRFNSTKEDYRGWATSLRDAAMDLAKETEKGDAADQANMMKLLQSMKSTCGACHDVYRE